MPGLLDLDKAAKELEEKDLLTIERETALTWGGRAAASYRFVLEDDDHAERMRCFWEAETYRAEAVEHAAMAEDARFAERLTAEIEGHRSKARERLLQAGHAFVEGNRTPRSQRRQRLAERQPSPPSPPIPSSPPNPPSPPPEAPLRLEDVPPGRRRSTSTPGLGRRPGS